MDLVAERFPYLAAMWDNMAITGIRLILVTDDPDDVPGVSLERDGVVIDDEMVLATGVAALGDLPTVRWSGEAKDPGPWKVKIDMEALSFPTAYRESYTIDSENYYRFKDGVARDMLIIVHYTLPS
jgi:hypothetical protein